jgi:hypothetical protein
MCSPSFGARFFSKLASESFYLCRISSPQLSQNKSASAVIDDCVTHNLIEMKKQSRQIKLDSGIAESDLRKRERECRARIFTK